MRKRKQFLNKMRRRFAVAMRHSWKNVFTKYRVTNMRKRRRILNKMRKASNKVMQTKIKEYYSQYKTWPENV